MYMSTSCDPSWCEFSIDQVSVMFKKLLATAL